MHRLMISMSEPELTRRSFMFGATAISALALAGIGTPGIAQGFRGSSGVTAYTSTAGRFRRTASGFVRCAANEERLCFNADGTFRGQYLQGADTYNSAPWDSRTAPHTVTDPAYLSGQSGTRIRYAGEHAEADLFGTTGGGVVIRNEITNQFHIASNIAATGIAVGDLLRIHAIVAISGATQAGRVDIGLQGNLNFAFTFNHDAAGVITGFTESWSNRRAGFDDMGTINGKRWWYLWVDVRAANTSNAPPSIGFGNIAAQTGKSYHVCELMVQRNPATPPASVPVCAVSKTFAADTLKTDLKDCGYVMNGLALARSQMTAGAIIPPAMQVGTPYEPLETLIQIVPGAEAADRAGIMPNPNQLLYARPWSSPVNHTLTFGPGWFPRDWLKANAASENATNVRVQSVFQSREDLRPILGNVSTSSTFVGSIDIDGVIMMAGGDTRTKYHEQADILTGTGSSFLLIAAGNIAVTNSLVLGSTLWPTRARHSIQQDDTDDRRVFMGELALQTTGGTLSLKGTRTHALARTVLSGTSSTTSITANTDQFCATRFWMDMLFISRGTFTSWTANQMLGALATARPDMFFCQSERPIRVSNDAGATWADLSPAFDPATLPHGFLGQHIGTWNFDTGVLSGAPDPARSLRVRYWQQSGIASPQVNKPGFQFIASQMNMGTCTRLPNSGDVFRIKNGSQWIDVTYQGGEWRSTGYVRYTGLTVNNPAVITTLVSNDFVQINRNDVTATGSNIFDGCVMIGPKGAYFLTGDPSLGATGSNLDNFSVTNTVVISDGTNGLRWDHSRINPARCFVQNALFIEARSDFTYNDGTGYSLTIGGAGIRNVLTFGNNVTVMGSKIGGGLEASQGGAVYVGSVRTITAGRRSNYDAFSAPDPKFEQYLRADNFDAVQGRARLPSMAGLWSFNLTAFADDDAGFGARAIITAAKGEHGRWNAVIDEIMTHYHRTPDRVVSITSGVPVGTVLASNVTADRFHPRYGGHIEGYFSIVGNQLQVARPLTGLDRIFILRGANNEMSVIDVRP